jgi:NAD(P)-dependent dehydrogenase (short-subunit alcohol dehydrogenase family)
MGKLEGKVAVITGGNSGIGLATAKKFAEHGAKVVISGRDPKTLEKAAKDIGVDTLAVRADVADTAELDSLFDQVKARFGGIDVLFVNAGIAKFAPLSEATAAHFDEVVGVNLKGAYFTIQKALPLLNHGASVILNTTAVDRLGLPGTSVYSASKAAVRSLARTLSAELIERGIRVNVVAPGPIETPILGRLGLSPDGVKEIAQGLLSRVPVKRFGRPEDIAEAVLFLASPDSAYVVGVELSVDGGMSQL